jgi:hypothetical protein
MPGLGRIIYYITRSSGPSGGIKVLLEHVKALRDAGFDAYAYAKNREQTPTAFDIDVPILSGSIGISKQDVIIRPETFRSEDLIASARGGLRQVVFVQNHYYCHHSLGSAKQYTDLGVSDVFCASQRIKRYLESNGIAQDVSVVPCAIEIPSSDPDKIEQIAVMPRKRPMEFDFIRHHFSLRNPDLAEVPWMVIDNLPHRRALEALSCSTVFLSLQRFEGFGLPALEAMAAGCLVVGFAGDGGWDYADTANGLWVPDDALEAAADALATGLRGLRAGEPSILSMINAGRATVFRYGPEAREQALIGFFGKYMAQEPGRLMP